jgi:hypothetical protein
MEMSGIRKRPSLIRVSVFRGYANIPFGTAIEEPCSDRYQDRAVFVLAQIALLKNTVDEVAVGVMIGLKILVDGNEL